MGTPTVLYIIYPTQLAGTVLLPLLYSISYILHSWLVLYCYPYCTLYHISYTAGWYCTATPTVLYIIYHTLLAGTVLLPLLYSISYIIHCWLVLYCYPYCTLYHISYTAGWYCTATPTVLYIIY